MIDSTLCYLYRGDEVLMMHRTRKKNDMNHDKWVAIGGRFEDKESPEDCALREVWEETGLTLLDCASRGIVRFRSDNYEDEDMHLFTATRFTGEIIDCDEGDLAWIDKAELLRLTMWEGDKVFLKLLETRDDYFDVTLSYRGEALVGVSIDGQRVESW